MNRIRAIIIVLFILTFSATLMSMTFDKIEEGFKNKQINCLQTLVTLSGCDEALIKDDSHIKEFIDKLNDLVFEDTVESHYFNIIKQDGYSSCNLIKRGSISGIYCNFDYAKKLAYVDTCSSRLYNPSLISWFASNWFKAKKSEVNVIDRK